MSDNTYQGFANYATWNVELWADNEYDIYTAKCAWLERKSKPVRAWQAKRFYLDYITSYQTDLRGNTEPGTRTKDIDFSDLAEHWETDRLEMLAYRNRE